MLTRTLKGNISGCNCPILKMSKLTESLDSLEYSRAGNFRESSEFPENREIFLHAKICCSTVFRNSEFSTVLTKKQYTAVKLLSVWTVYLCSTVQVVCNYL